MKVKDIKPLYELDNKTNPEECLTYHLSTLTMLKERMIKEGVLDTWVNNIVAGLLEDYIWLYQNNVILQKYPRAYLKSQQYPRFDEYKKRVDLFNVYLDQNRYLWDTSFIDE